MIRIPKMFFTICIPVDWKPILDSMAREKRVSTAEIIRRAVKEKYFSEPVKT